MGAIHPQIDGHAGQAPLPSVHGFSVRDGRLAPITCVRCGCRLRERDDGAWVHFRGDAGRDARGCTVECVNAPHNVATIGLDFVASPT
jgi:hypothetical protein